MCGLLGYVDFCGEAPPPLELVPSAAILTSRGADASGCMVFNGSLWMSKSPERLCDTITRFWNHLQQTPNVQWVAFHARAATKGSAPDNNDNNHPVIHGNIAVMHNGVISNDTEVFKKLQTTPNAEVDTEAIAACLDVGGIQKLINTCRGSIAISYVDLREPGTVHLYTNGNSPLYITQTPGHHIAWASDPHYFIGPIAGETVEKVADGTHLIVANGQVTTEAVGVGTTKTYPPVVFHNNFHYSDPNFSDKWFYCFDPQCLSLEKLGAHMHNHTCYPTSLHWLHARKGEDATNLILPIAVEAPMFRNPFIGIDRVKFLAGELGEFPKIADVPRDRELRFITRFYRHCSGCIEEFKKYMEAWNTNDSTLYLFSIQGKTEDTLIHGLASKMPGRVPKKDEPKPKQQALMPPSNLQQGETYKQWRRHMQDIYDDV